jgi:hypothetical protein
MEDIFKSLLKKQGYEHIGIVDAEKKIWGYAKDGVYHFCCADDLSDIDRKSIGFTDDICVLSIVDDNVVNVEDLSKFVSGVVIDNNNSITKGLKQMEVTPMNNIQPYYQLKRIKSDSIVIIENSYIPLDYQRLNRKSDRDWESYVQMRSDHPQFISLNFDKLDRASNLVYLDGKCIQDAKLYMYLDDYYFFRIDTNIRIYHSKEGLLYDGCLSYLWDTTSYLYLIHIAEPNVVSIQTIDSCRKQIFNTNVFVKYLYFSKDNYDNYILYDYKVICSDHYLIIPFTEKNLLFVISDKEYNFTAKCIAVDNNNDVIIQNDIIRTSHESFCGGYYNGEFQGGTNTEYNYYDVDGTEYRVQKETAKGECIVAKKSKSDNDSDDDTGRLYGIIDEYKSKFILPAIYNRIEYIDESTYKVEILNSTTEPPQKLVGLYSKYNGFLSPIGVEVIIPQYNIPYYDNTKYNEFGTFIVFSIGNSQGLVVHGKKVLDAIYDCINGYGYYGKYFGEYYTPRSVIVSQKGLGGLYFDNVFIAPQYDSITCCMLLRNYAFFKVNKGKKWGIISDSNKFNDISKCIYDKVEVEDREKEFIAKVFIGEEVGLLFFCSDIYGLVSPRFRSLDVLRKGYIGDDIYYNMDGVGLSKDNESVFVSEGYHCVAFKNKSTNEYSFVDYCGNKLTYEFGENDNDLLHIRSSSGSCFFDIKKGIFINDIKDDSYKGAWYAEERRFFENEGYRDAYDGNPDAEWNTD